MNGWRARGLVYIVMVGTQAELIARLQAQGYARTGHICQDLSLENSEERHRDCYG